MASSRVFLGNISEASEILLTKYLNKFMPDAAVEPLKEGGIRGRIKNHAVRPDVVLVVLDEKLYGMCEGVAKDVLALPKVHKYTSEDGFREFLVNMFGVLDTPFEPKIGIEPDVSNQPDVIVAQEGQGVSTTEEVIDEFDNLAVTEIDSSSDKEDKDLVIRRLNDDIIVKDTIIRNLEAQLEEKSSNEDVKHFIGRIKDLESQIENQGIELNELRNKSFADLGRVTKAEQVLETLEQLKADLKEERDRVNVLSNDKSSLESQLSDKEEELDKLIVTVSSLNTKLSDYDDIVSRSEVLESDITDLRSQLEIKVSEVKELGGINKDLDDKIINLNAELSEIPVLKEQIDKLTSQLGTLKEDSEKLGVVTLELNNLKVDLQKAGNSNTDLQDKLEESLRDIEEKAESINSLSAELESVKASNKELVRELDSISSKLSIKDDEISRLTDELSTYKGVSSELDTATSRIKDLESDIVLKDSTIADLNAKVLEGVKIHEDLESLRGIHNALSLDHNDTLKQLEDMKSTLDMKSSDYNNLASENEALSKQLEDVKSSLDTKSFDYDNLVSENKVILKQLDDTKESLSSKIDEVESLNQVIAHLESESSNTVKQLEDTKDELSIKINEIESLKTSIESVNSTLSVKQSEIDSLRLELDSKSSLIQDLTSKSDESSNLVSEIERLKENLNNKSEEVTVLSNQVNGYELQIKEKSDELITKVIQIQDLEKQVSDYDLQMKEKSEELTVKVKRIEELESAIKGVSSELDTLRVQNEDLVAENSKLGNKVISLEQQSTDSDIVRKSNTELENQVTELRKQVARISSENSDLKLDLEKQRNDVSSEVELAKLRSEISDYKDKIRELNRIKESTHKMNEEEVTRLRERCANLELELVSTTDKLNASNNSIFKKMDSIKTYKAPFNQSLNVTGEFSNMYVFASGSSESNLSAYQTLRSYCASTSKSVLILDLVTDSHIDRVFGIGNFNLAQDFFEGKQSIKEVVSRANVGNTYILSTAFRYLNSLYLMRLDWDKILSEIKGVFDTVIIYVGCLTDILSKVLFNTFNSVMKSHIVVKASPINIRTALLTLTGLPSTKRSMVSCVNFDSSSEKIYQTLAMNFNTQILKDSDVLRL